MRHAARESCSRIRVVYFGWKPTIVVVVAKLALREYQMSNLQNNASVVIRRRPHWRVFRVCGPGRCIISADLAGATERRFFG